MTRFILFFSLAIIFGIDFNCELLKGDVGNAILDTKGKIVLALFSVCNKQTGVS